MNKFNNIKNDLLQHNLYIFYITKIIINNCQYITLNALFYEIVKNINNFISKQIFIFKTIINTLNNESDNYILIYYLLIFLFVINQ